VQILPFAGECNIYNHVNIAMSVYEAANDTVAMTSIRALLCPSNRNSGRGNDYAGCHHDAKFAIDLDNHGVLYLNSRVRYDEIADGTAQTLLLGETVEGSEALGWISGTRSTLRSTGVPLNDREAISKAAKTSLPFKGLTARDDIFARISDLAQEGQWPLELTGGFASRHPFSSNFLFCNGAVRSIASRVDPRVYRCLGNRADGELLSSDSY
jgi:hypothetical protein